MRSKAAAEIVEQQDWLDAPAESVQTAIAKTYDALGEAKEPVRQALNGDWMGHPLHPAVVVVPIGAFSMAAALDAMPRDEGNDGAVETLIEIGLATSVFAAVTGATQWYGMKSQELKRVGLTHATANTVALGLFGASLILRKANSRSLGKALSTIGLTVLTFSAFLGGHMVYQRQAGVE